MKKSEILKIINKHLDGEMRKNVTIAGVKNMSRADLDILHLCLQTNQRPNFGAAAEVYKKITQD